MLAHVRILAAVMAVLALAACGEQGTGAEPPDASPTVTERTTAPDPTGAPSEEPTEDMTDDTAGESISGTLGGDTELEGGCAWLEASDGTRYEILWPDGYQIQMDPLQLVGPDGEAVASAGDEVTVRGRPAEDMASICMVGPIFQATEVQPSG